MVNFKHDRRKKECGNISGDDKRMYKVILVKSNHKTITILKFNILITLIFYL